MALAMAGPAGPLITYMNIPSIKLSYRQMIDRNSNSPFEKQVFEDSYCELLMQAQRYNKDNQFKSFQDMIANDPKARSLHYKVGFAIGLYVKELDQWIPGLTDNLGALRIPFNDYQFSIVESDLTDKKKHIVSITYTSPAMLLLGSAGHSLIIGSADAAEPATDNWINSFLLPMQEGLTISEYRAAPSVAQPFSPSPLLHPPL